MTTETTTATTENRSILSNKKGGPEATLSFFFCNFLCSFVLCDLCALRDLCVEFFSLPARRSCLCRCQLRDQKFHHRPGLGSAALQPVIRISQRMQSRQQARLRNLARILQCQFRLLRPHPQGACRLPPTRDAFHFARFDQLAVHPGHRAQHGERLFAVPQQAIQEFQRLLRLARRQQVRQLPNRRGLLRNHQRAHIRAPDHFFLRRKRRQLVDLRLQPHQVRRYKLRKIFRGAFFEFHALLFPNRPRQRHGRRLPFPGVFAQPAFHHQCFLRQQLPQFHPLIQSRRFHHQHREWRRIFQVRTEPRDGLVPIFFSQLLDRFHILEENHLLWRKHGKRLRLLERRLRLSALRRIPRYRPGPRRFRHKSLDQLCSARVAKVWLFAQQQNRRNGFPLLQPPQQFFRRYSRHRILSPVG